MPEMSPPTPLKSAIFVRYESAGVEHWVLYGACELKVIENADARMVDPTECLHVSGNIVADRSNLPASLQTAEIVIPCKYVAYVGLGPEVEFISGERKILWILPTAPGPKDGAMSLERIEATLKELRDPG